MTYTKLTFNIKAPKPHDFIGSKIRGALGYTLKDEVCINPSFKCNGCFAQNKCIFYSMYEAQKFQHNYRLDFKLYDKKFRFSIFLFNDLQKYRDTIKKALLNSLKNYKDIKTKEKTKTLKVKKHNKLVKLYFQTPLRIKKNNQFATNYQDIDINDILLSIYKKSLSLQNKSFRRLEFNENLQTISKYLKYKKIIRKSSRQNNKMDFGGLMGYMILNNIDKKTYKLLKIGEIIGVGKSTAFGLGKIKLEDLDD